VTNNTHSPASLKGAFVAYYPETRQTRVTTFQLNPESIQRELVPGKTGVFFKTTGVRERIAFDLHADACLGDGYFDRDGEINPQGISGFIASLELLIYPAEISDADTAARSGGDFHGIFSAILAFVGFKRQKPVPLVSLVFGDQRIVPVRICSIQIHEQAFNTILNPVRACIHIDMQTLTEAESEQHPYMEEIYKNYLRHKTAIST